MGGQTSIAFLQERFPHTKWDVECTRDGEKCTPLIEACNCGVVSSVEFLLSQRVDVNRVCQGRGSALRVASARGYANIVSLLLNSEADAQRCFDRLQAIHYAVRGHHTAVLRILAQHYKYQKDVIPLFCYSTVHGTWECQRVLIHCGIAKEEIRALGAKVLSTSLAKGDIRLVQKLLDLGCPVDPVLEHMTPLHGAAQLGYVDICHLLLERGASLRRKHADPDLPHDMRQNAEGIAKAFHGPALAKVFEKFKLAKLDTSRRNASFLSSSQVQAKKKQKKKGKKKNQRKGRK